MSNLQNEKENYVVKLELSGQLTKMDIIEQNLNAIDFGYELCQKEYEEKLRWIPVEEKLPKTNSEVLAKDINGDIEKVLFHTINFSIMHNLGYITHWRYFL